MIPPTYRADSPPGEIRLFSQLAADRTIDDWTVLHSLDLASHVRQSQGEADFVVIAPALGIAVIEVKSHRTVARDESGMWHLGRQQPTNRSPFKQADEAKYSIKNYLEKRDLDLGSVPILSGVWFTCVRARSLLSDSPEWHPWQLLDLDDFRGGVGSALTGFFEHGRKHLAASNRRFAGKPDFAHGKITRALRPQFELARSGKDLSEERQEQLDHFLDEQFDALDAMAANTSVVFTGPAGAGKTFLALEAVRREPAESRTLLLCYNRLLGDDLAKRAISVAPHATVSSFHRMLLSIAGDDPPDDADPLYWTADLPLAAAEVLLNGDGPVFDFLVVDEVQDLCQEEYLDVFDLLLEGGLAGGRCLFFGDFERQAIFGAGDGRERLAHRIGAAPNFRLSVNCRNLPRVGTTVEVVSRMSPGFGRFRRADDGVTPRILWTSRGSSSETQLRSALRSLLDDGFAPADVVVLSPFAASSTASTTTDPWLQNTLSPWSAASERVRFTTIQSFKGLESPAVVVTDIPDEDADYLDSLLYVALTRATDRLIIVASEEAISDRIMEARF